jgi:SAM-dependent methyltransferase
MAHPAMAHWDDGYVTDVAYTSNFYREITPTWLGFTSLLLGHRHPDLTRAFRYADLGCGNGFTALAVAAASPQAEVWGFDFNPAHVEFASALASRAGLANAKFVETSFAELAALPENALPDFDFIVAHGVLSWISPANRRQLMSVIARRLKPGGLVYLSYNVTTGWTAMVPIQPLMRMLASASPVRTDVAAAGVLDFIDRLKQAGALFLQNNPLLDSRLQDIRKQDARYIAHEYLNRDWHPLTFATIAGEMAEAKCRYIGSATLAENIDTVAVPAGVAPILAETQDIVLRETLRDIGCAQGFRRDVYRKGMAPVPVAEQQATLEAFVFAGLGMATPDGGPGFATPMGTVTGRPEIYAPLLAMIDAGPLSFRQARESPALAGRPLVEAMQAAALLVAGGYAHPMLPEGGTAAGRDAARRLNLAIARANANSAELPRLAAPAIGSAIGADMLETLVVGELLAGRPADAGTLADELVAVLARSGRNVQRDGAPVTEPVEARRVVADAVHTMIEKRLPVLRGLGVLDGCSTI